MLKALRYIWLITMLRYTSFRSLRTPYPTIHSHRAIDASPSLQHHPIASIEERNLLNWGFVVSQILVSVLAPDLLLNVPSTRFVCCRYVSATSVDLRSLYTLRVRPFSKDDLAVSSMLSAPFPTDPELQSLKPNIYRRSISSMYPPLYPSSSTQQTLDRTLVTRNGLTEEKAEAPKG